MFSPLRVGLLVATLTLPAIAIGQECVALHSASVAKAVDHVQHAPDEAASAGCVKLAFHQVAKSPSEQAIPLLISYLGYKRPLNEGERHGIFMHGPGPDVLYPAVHELCRLGEAAESSLVRFIAEGKSAEGVGLDNALYTLILIHHGNIMAVIQKLHSEVQARRAM